MVIVIDVGSKKDLYRTFICICKMVRSTLVKHGLNSAYTYRHHSYQYKNYLKVQVAR